jgi:hypothetical protein
MYGQQNLKPKDRKRYSPFYKKASKWNVHMNASYRHIPNYWTNELQRTDN